MDNELRTHRRYAEFRKGTSDKFYEVEVQELEPKGQAKVTFRYGRIGQAGQSKEDTFIHFGAASLAADNKFAEKLAKGYVETKSALHALAAAFETPEDRPNRGLPPAEIETPAAWGLGQERDARLTAFVRKYVDKLNLIRASRDDLTAKLYAKQVSNLLQQYAREWRRVADSQQFAGLELAPVRARVGVIYQALRAQSGTMIAQPDWSSAYAEASDS